MRSWANPTWLPPGWRRAQWEFSLWQVELKKSCGVDAMYRCLISWWLQGELFSGCWVELPPTLTLHPHLHDSPRSRRALIFDTCNAETRGSLKAIQWCNTTGLFGVALKSYDTHGWCRTHSGGLPGGLGTLSFSHNMSNVVWPVRTHTQTQAQSRWLENEWPVCQGIWNIHSRTANGSMYKSYDLVIIAVGRQYLLHSYEKSGA